MDSFTNSVQDRVPVVIDETVRLGPVGLRLVSNVPAFLALQYFRRLARSAHHDEAPQFELWRVSLEGVDLDREYLLEHVDRTYRGTSFLRGYYADPGQARDSFPLRPGRGVSGFSLGHMAPLWHASECGPWGCLGALDPRRCPTITP